MGGGSKISGNLPRPSEQRLEEVEASSSSSSEPAFSESDAGTPSIFSSEAKQSDDSFRRCKAYLDLLQSYKRPEARGRDLQEAIDVIIRHKPGDWIEEVGGLERSDYEIPETMTLLLVGPRGSGKSALLNRITRVFEDDLFAPDRAQVSYNPSVTEGSCFLQEYMIPRNSKSLCVYDTRSLSCVTDDNIKSLGTWMTQGVRHGEIVTRISDGVTEKNRIKAMTRQRHCPCQKRMVNFVIFVVDGVSILKSMDGKDTQYNDLIVKTFNYPFLSFKDNKPVVVVTHGDELTLQERAHVRTHLGEILGIPPQKQIFDIPDTTDYDTKLAIVDMLCYSIELADRNLPFKQNSLLEGWKIVLSTIDRSLGFEGLLLTVDIIIIIIIIIIILLLVKMLLR